MRHILILLSCLLLAQTAMVGVAHAENEVASIDIRRLLEASEAGKSIQAALKTKRDVLQKEANALEKKIVEQQQALIKGKKDMKAEEFEAKAKTLQEDFVKARETVTKKVSDLDNQRKTAVKTLQEHIAKVTADIADERKIKVVLDREAVVIIDQSLDLTEEALKRLNAKVTSIAVK